MKRLQDTLLEHFLDVVGGVGGLVGITGEHGAQYGASPWANSVEAATTCPLPPCTSMAGVLAAKSRGPLPSIDGLVGIRARRILVKDQHDPSENGLYEVVSAGDSHSHFTLRRTFEEYSYGALCYGTAVFVNDGEQCANTSWVLSTPYDWLGAVTNGKWRWADRARNPAPEWIMFGAPGTRAGDGLS